MTPELVALIEKYFPWAAPVLVVAPFIPKVVKRYQAWTKGIADAALEDERLERESCDKRIAEAKEAVKSEWSERLATIEARLASVEEDARVWRVKAERIQLGLNRFIRLYWVHKANPEGQDAAVADLAKLADGDGA